MAYLPSGRSDYFVASVSVNFFFLRPNEDRSHFYRLTEDCSRADWDGVCGYLRDVPLEDICKFGSSAEITYKSLLSFVPTEEIFCI